MDSSNTSLNGIIIKHHTDKDIPSPNEIFVFGSNERGIHGAGSAYAAVTKYGAKRFIGRGISGMSYAIPTKDTNIKTRSLEDIKVDVNIFVDFVNSNKDINFFITRVGCGLAGYHDHQIAPMFKGINFHLGNCNFPKTWLDYMFD